MDPEKANTGSLETELYQPDPFLQAQYLHTVEYSRRDLFQRRAWNHVVVVAVSIALIFLVVKCTMQLASYNATSVRMLAEESFPWRRQPPGQRPLLQLLSNDDESCGTASSPRRHPRHRLDKRRGPFFREQGESEPHDATLGGEGSSGEASEIPSSLPASSDVFDNPASGEHPQGPRVKHETTLALGDVESVLFKDYKKRYGFPLIGREPRYERLHTVLEKLEEVMDGLCFPHKFPYSSHVRAEYTPAGAEQAVHIYMVISEDSYGHSSGFSQFGKFVSTRKSMNNRHFRRQAAVVAEEMVAKTLAEIDEKGVPVGGTTRWYFVFYKPQSVPTSGRVKVEVFATPNKLPEPVKDEWPW